MVSLAAFVPLLVASAVTGADADRLLLERARAAFDARDVASGRRWLRGWASLRQRDTLPEGLEPEAADAVNFVETSGRLRLYGSWRDGVVRVGLNDPARIVDRVDVFAVDGEGHRAQMARVGVSPDGRLSYRLDSGAADRVVAEAVVMIDGQRAVLATTVLRRREVGLPPAPDPEVLSRNASAPPPGPLAPIQEPEAGLKWWWVVAGIVAAGAVGAAVIQQDR